MNLQEIEDHFVTLPEIARESGQSRTTVGNWAKYHRYFPTQQILGRPVVARSDLERFKAEHPELFKAPAPA